MVKFEDRGLVLRYNVSDVTAYLGEKHGPDYVDYRNKWENAGKDGTCSEVPLCIYLELNSHCNLKCKMCPHSMDFFTRPAGKMSMDIIDKIVEQCKQLKIPSILLGASTECLTHPDIKEILQKLKSTGVLELFLLTNGVKLTEEISNLIVDLQIERLNVSIDAATSETYKKIRGSELSIVENNINNFLKIKAEKKSKLPFLRVSFVKQEDNIHEIDNFYEKWKDYADTVDFQTMVDFSMLNELENVDCEEFMCESLYQKIAIGWDGNLYPCCGFFQKYLLLGNINDMSIIEAWTSPKMINMRKNFLKHPPLACKNCYKFRSYTEDKVQASV